MRRENQRVAFKIHDCINATIYSRYLLLSRSICSCLLIQLTNIIIQGNLLEWACNLKNCVTVWSMEGIKSSILTLLKSAKEQVTLTKTIKVIHQSLLSHKLVYNGGFSNFKLSLLVSKRTYVVQHVCRLSYKV